MKKANIIRPNRILASLWLLAGFLGATANAAEGNVIVHDYSNPDYIKSTLIKVAEWQLQHQTVRDSRGAANGVFYTGIFPDSGHG
ncbi:MAG: hypothetical protein WCT04_21455 [Planctomycetota bacterium]